MSPALAPLDRAQFDAAFEAALDRAWRLAGARRLRGSEAEAFCERVLARAFRRVAYEEDGAQWAARVIEQVALEGTQGTPAPASASRSGGRGTG